MRGVGTTGEVGNPLGARRALPPSRRLAESRSIRYRAPQSHPIPAAVYVTSLRWLQLDNRVPASFDALIEHEALPNAHEAVVSNLRLRSMSW
ncbi:unnamed protein product [Ixodes pacificus]